MTRKDWFFFVWLEDDSRELGHNILDADAWYKAIANGVLLASIDLQSNSSNRRTSVSKYTTEYISKLPPSTLFAGIDLGLDSFDVIVLNATGQRLTTRAAHPLPKMQGIGACMNKLLRYTWHMVNRGEQYDPERWQSLRQSEFAKRLLKATRRKFHQETFGDLRVQLGRPCLLANRRKDVEDARPGDTSDD